MAGKIFINYRRDDSIGMAGRLHDRLAQAFGRDKLFMDVDHIPAGVDFENHLNSQVAECDVILVVIGPGWLNAKDEAGKRRLHQPDDFVAIEIAAALARDIRVIPVLVEGTRMPKASELPDALKPLARRQAVDARHSHFGRDADALIEKIREALNIGPVTPRPWRRMALAGAAAAAILLPLGWIGLSLMPAPRPSAADAMQTAKPRADEAEQQRLAALRAEQEEERKALAAAEAEAKRKNEEIAQQRTAAAKAEEDRRRAEAEAAEARRKSEEAEQQRMAALKAEEDRRRAEAEAEEARRRSEEAERQRMAALKAEEDRRRAEADTRSRWADAIKQGNTAGNAGDLDTAIASFSEAIRLNPTDALAFMNRGVAYRRKGDDVRAIADYSEAIRRDPKDARTFRNRGVAYLSKRDYDRAIADYSEAIRLEPAHAFAYFNRAIGYDGKGDSQRAIADYTEAIRLDPTQAAPFLNRGIAYSTKRDYDRAIADYNEAIRLSPNYALAFMNRGLAYAKKGDYRQAIANYTEAIRYSIDLTPRHSALTYCERGIVKLKINDRSGNADIAKARQLDASVCR